MFLHQFYFDAVTRARNSQERYGQAMFNHLRQVRPDLAERVRGTDKDPFYVSALTDPRWDRFVAFIENEWRQKPEGECKGKAAARALAVMVLDDRINGYLLARDLKILEQAREALEPFGYPDVDALKARLGLP
jgi:hypothetical protein